MAANIEGVGRVPAGESLEPARGLGRGSGFGTLLGRELADFWGTRTWLIQVLTWLALGPGLMLLMLVPQLITADGDGETPGEVASVIAKVLPVTAGTLVAIAAVILAQGKIVGEKESGTAAWVLSKPVSRAAFVLSRFLALGSGIIIAAVAVQCAGAYGIVAVVEGPAPVLRYLAAMGAISLHILFYLALSLMLGAFCRSRNPVIAIPLVLMFVMGQWLGGFELTGVAGALLAGRDVGSAGPIAAGAYAVLILGLLAMAIRRFNREEF